MNKPDDSYAYTRIPEHPVVVDLTGCKYLGEVHAVLKASLGLPDFYGANWDALRDLLDGFRPYPLAVELHGVHFLPAEMGGEVEKMLRIFDEIHQKTPHIAFKIVS